MQEIRSRELIFEHDEFNKLIGIENGWEVVSVGAKYNIKDFHKPHITIELKEVKR